MTLPLSPSALPPPVIFSHAETLHAISLPPLALFLASLHRPDHLLKLHDILDRYRTPKSYHRIDVRLVESSELPLSQESEDHVAAAGKGAEAETAEMGKRRKRTRGSPVILPEGVTLEVYQAQQTAEEGPGSTMDVQGTNAEAGPSTASPRVPTSPATLAQQLLADSSLRTSLHDQPLPSTLHRIRSPVRSSPPRAKPPAPQAPARRVRELRLDLRTLDAAALFNLEVWRREALGLEKLDMEVPDSIWYKDPTEEAEAQPELEKVNGKQAEGEVETVKKRRGRPPKKRRPSGEELVDALVEGARTELEVDADALAVAGEEIGEEKILEALDALSREEQEATNFQQEEEEEGESERSPSADIMLDDAFNEREEDDPDFAPEPERSQPAGGSGRRGRKRGRFEALAGGSSPRLEDGGMDLMAENFGPDTGSIEKSVAEAAGAGATKGRLQQGGEGGGERVPQGTWLDPVRVRPHRPTLRRPASPASDDPSTLLPEVPATGGKRRKSVRMSLEAVEIPGSRRASSNTPRPEPPKKKARNRMSLDSVAVPAKQRKAGGARGRKSHGAVSGSDKGGDGDDSASVVVGAEDDEWAFLRGF